MNIFTANSIRSKTFLVQYERRLRYKLSWFHQLGLSFIRNRNSFSHVFDIIIIIIFVIAQQRVLKVMIQERVQLYYLRATMQ